MKIKIQKLKINNNLLVLAEFINHISISYILFKQLHVLLKY